MILFFINLFEVLKKFWLFVSLLIIFSVLIKKADDDNLNSSRLPFLDGSKKSENFFNNFIWFNIFIYLCLAIIFSTKHFS